MNHQEILKFKKFTEFNGDLYKHDKLFRKQYIGNTKIIECGDVAALKAAIRAGGYTMLGGYTIAFCKADGDCYSYEGIKQAFPEIVSDWINGYNTLDIILLHSGQIDPSEYEHYRCEATNELIFNV